MISEENNEELRPPEQPGSDESVADEMSIDDDATVAALREDSPIGPGQLLTRKREALGMTVQQVADELHITMHYVRALESNTYDKLPGDVFIRGYIRSYASLLKLDPLVLVNLYNEFTNQQASSEQGKSSNERRRKDRNLPWIVVSGIAFVGIAIALWYFNTREPVAPVAPLQGATSPVPAQVVVPARALSDGTTPSLDNVATTLAADIVSTGTDTSPASLLSLSASPVTESFAEPVADPLAPRQETPAPEVGVAASVSEADAAAVDLENGPATAPTSAGEITPVLTPEFTQEFRPESTQESAPDTPPNTAPDTAPDTAPQSTPAPVDPNLQAASAEGNVEPRVISVNTGGEDLVQITFNGESMVQVEDGRDNQIYRDIRTRGDVLRITGSAPFNILLGDAASTELSLNGSSIDFTSNIRIDNSVRLTIGL